MSRTGPSVKNAVRVVNRNSCGSGSFVGEQSDGSYVLTNAHVAGTSIGRTVRIDVQIPGQRSPKSINGRVILAAYSDRTQADWCVVFCDGYSCSDDGIKPVRLSKQKPSLQKSYYTMGSPRCVWPLVNTDIAPVDMRPNMPLWRWRPNAIGGQSGSGVWSDDDNLQYGILTWSWAGLGAGQQSAAIWRQAINQTTAGLPRLEGMEELPSDVQPSENEDLDDPIVENGMFAETDNISDLPIWYDGEPDEIPKPDSESPQGSIKTWMIEFLRDQSEWIDSKRKNLEEDKVEDKPEKPIDKPGCGKIFGLSILLIACFASQAQAQNFGLCVKTKSKVVCQRNFGLKLIQPVQKTVVKTTTWANERVSARWTWPGYPMTAPLRRHLLSTHRVDVRKLTNKQVIVLHNRMHDGTYRAVTKTRRVICGAGG